jgi:hypothetical protein
VTEFRLELRPEYGARRARALVEGALELWEVDDPGADVLLVVTELVENVHQHAAGGGELRIALDGNGILIQVRDTSTAVPALRSPLRGATAGYGLRLVQAVAKDWGVRLHSAGKTVWAEVALVPVDSRGSGAARTVWSPSAREPAGADPHCR